MIGINLYIKVAAAVHSYFTEPVAPKEESAGPDRSDQSAIIWLMDLIFTPQTPAAGCSSAKSNAQPGVHFNLIGEARDNWSKAEAQVLEKYCGVSDATPEQVEKGGLLLRGVNEDHLKNGVPGVINYKLDTPRGVDHRIGSSLINDTEIFIPTPTPLEICPVYVPPAGSAQAQPPFVAVLTDAGSQQDAQAPAPADSQQPVPQPGAEIARLKDRLKGAIRSSDGVKQNLINTGNAEMKGMASSLQTKIGAAQKALSSDSADEVQSALKALSSERARAQAALDRYLKNL